MGKARGPGRETRFPVDIVKGASPEDEDPRSRLCDEEASFMGSEVALRAATWFGMSRADAEVLAAGEPDADVVAGNE